MILEKISAIFSRTINPEELMLGNAVAEIIANGVDKLPFDNTKPYIIDYYGKCGKNRYIARVRSLLSQTTEQSYHVGVKGNDIVFTNEGLFPVSKREWGLR